MADARSIGELEIQEELLKLMQDSREWSNAELKQRLRHALPWSDADLEVSEERPNELFWEQRVNNALSPARSSSLYSKGHVEHGDERGTHRITENGLRFIREEWSFEDLDEEMRRRQSESDFD
ncbi:winged helix-turn-helix domain-containing protein [Sphingomonas daechungensis]|uniref:winged helix-turn-helix domain-containing protein n=1 Tax=Sphingomonas daechungensis TaxID=1176646 RepID=UPI0037830EB2